MNEEMNKEHTGMIQIALSINKSNLEHIEFLEKKVLDLQIIIDNVRSAIDYTCCGDEITQEVKETGRCPSCSENI
jgi:hypothetical protein